jgi:hypothetical protein
MASYNLKYNSDDSVIRHIIIGLVADLNNKIYLMNQTSNETRVKIDIPFYYSFTGDEDVLYDYFLLDDSLDPEKKKAIANYDVVPRGIVNMTSSGIDSASLLNKYVRGTYQKLEDGQMKAYVAQFQMIPFIMNFDCKIWVDTQLDLFRVTEGLIKKLYKTNNYNVDVGHVEDGTYRIACGYKMPEDYEMERPIEFSFDDEKRKSVTFTIELIAFIPAFEPNDEQFAGNRIMNFTHSQEIKLDIENDIDVGGPDSIWNKVNK